MREWYTIVGSVRRESGECVVRKWRVCVERIGNVWCGERVWSVWCVERVGSVWCEMIVGVSGERVF